MDLVWCMKCQEPAFLDDLVECKDEYYHETCFESHCEDEGLCRSCASEPVHQEGASDVRGKYCGGCMADMRDDDRASKYD